MRRYLLVHTHPENLVIGPLAAQQFATLPLSLGTPIESRLYSLQADLFAAPAIREALATPGVEVVCLCLRTSDRYGEAARLGMTVIEVADIVEAYSRAQDLLPRVETRDVPPDEFGPGFTQTTTYWEPRR